MTRRARGIACAAACLLAWPAAGQEPTTRPEAPPETWGPSKAGLQVSLSVDEPVSVGGSLGVRLAVRNVGTVPVALPPGKQVFGWLVVVYTRENAFLTERVFPAGGLDDWPTKLAGGKAVRLRPTDLSARGAYGYGLARQIYRIYLDPKSKDALPKPDGPLSRKLSVGTARVKWMLCLPRAGQPPLVVSSNTVTLEVGPPELKRLDPAARKAFMARLLRQFDRDAWGGQAAHRKAVALGPEVLAELIPAALQRRRPGHSRLWLATALADIRDERSVEALIQLLDDTIPGVRHVAAYHGPKQRSAKLDEAIVAKVLQLKEDRMTALAVLGFLVFRGPVPEKLLAVSLGSDDPRVRSAAVRALTRHASDFNVSRLAARLTDRDERVRTMAARSLGAMDRPAPAVIGALIEALDAPGETARQAICEALGRLTKKELPYDPKADEKVRAETLRAWRAFRPKEKARQD